MLLRVVLGVVLRRALLSGFVVALAACSTGQLNKRQLRECCLAGAFERCGKGCINPGNSELGACREYQSCRAKCAGKNDYMGQSLSGNPADCIKLCARRAQALRPAIPPRCPASQQELGDLPEASETLDIGEQPNAGDGGSDLPDGNVKSDLPDAQADGADLPDNSKVDLPSDNDR